LRVTVAVTDRVLTAHLAIGNTKPPIGYAFIPDSGNPFSVCHGTAHELGHRILRHSSRLNLSEEVEVNYFARKLTGLSRRKVFLYHLSDIIVNCVMNPITVVRELVGGLTGKNAHVMELIDDIEHGKLYKL
jgi:hypothetical protein